MKTRSQQPIHRPLHLRINIDWKGASSTVGCRNKLSKRKKASLNNFGHREFFRAGFRRVVPRWFPLINSNTNFLEKHTRYLLSMCCGFTHQISSQPSFDLFYVESIDGYKLMWVANGKLQRLTWILICQFRTLGAVPPSIKTDLRWACQDLEFVKKKILLEQYSKCS